MTVEITYKLTHTNEEMQKTTLTMVLFCGLLSSGLLLGTNFTQDGEIQIVLVRATNAIFTILGLFYAGAFFYFGMKIERILLENHEMNENVISSLRRFRYLFTFYVFNACLVGLVSVIWPTIMNYFYPIEYIAYLAIVTFINVRLFLKRKDTPKSSGSSKKKLILLCKAN